jgi:NAD(P)-dependent dehydrogenase (short-subunit alcohol dehydrogenase family)
MESPTINHKTVLITGASSGIGLATVQRFVKENYFVYAHYHSQLGELSQLGSDQIHTVKANLEDGAECRRLFEQCMTHSQNKLDVLVNCAATYKVAETFNDISDDDFDYVMAVNLRAPFMLSKMAAKVMKANRFGRIVNLSSIGIKYGGNPASAAYTISKCALEQMTVTMAKAVARDNILVNAVRVGLTDTNLHSNAPEKNMQQRTALVPIGRMATPVEIANCIYFLASAESSFVAGSVFTVSGGE